MAEGLEPSVTALTVRRLTTWLRHKKLAAATRVELVSSRLQDERSGAIELRRNLVDWEGLKPSREVCRTSMLSLHHQPKTLVAAGGVEPPT